MPKTPTVSVRIPDALYDASLDYMDTQDASMPLSRLICEALAAHIGFEYTHVGAQVPTYFENEVRIKVSGKKKKKKKTPRDVPIA